MSILSFFSKSYQVTKSVVLFPFNVPSLIWSAFCNRRVIRELEALKEHLREDWFYQRTNLAKAQKSFYQSEKQLHKTRTELKLSQAREAYLSEQLDITMTEKKKLQQAFDALKPKECLVQDVQSTKLLAEDVSQQDNKSELLSNTFKNKERASMFLEEKWPYHTVRSDMFDSNDLLSSNG